MKYYSIRVVNAVDYAMAVEAVKAQAFDEKDSLCDAVLTKAELIEKLTKKKKLIVYHDIRCTCYDCRKGISHRAKD